MFIVIWALWPLIALMGGLGFNPVSSLAGVISTPTFLRSFRPRPYMIPLVAFFLYTAISAAWSPQPFAMIEFNLAKGAFNVRSEAVREGLLFLAMGSMLAAAMTFSEAKSRRIVAIARIALLVQVASLVVIAIFEKSLLQWLTRFVPDTGEGVQNISRDCLIMSTSATALVMLLAGAGQLKRIWPLAAVLLLVELAIVEYRGVDAASLGLATALACVLVVRFLPRNGFRVLGVVAAAAVMASPVIFGIISQGAQAETATTSAGWRLAIWAKACDVIAQHPVFGGGLGILRTMREHIPTGAFAGQLYMPNHPHNMVLQLWAESGGVGALLLAAALVAAAWRLPAPGVLGRTALHIAGFIGAASIIAFVSYDLWNAWWWAVAGLLGALTVLAHRAYPALAGTPAAASANREA